MEEGYIDTKNKNTKGTCIIRDTNIKESFSFEELLSEEEIEKLKSIL